jgi:hypothetical protein|tara:strand:+ start:37 stop:216 length:180 start_codon:yes stop_codon:yes gene_type:complete
MVNNLIKYSASLYVVYQSTATQISKTRYPMAKKTNTTVKNLGPDAGVLAVAATTQRAGR